MDSANFSSKLRPRLMNDARQIPLKIASGWSLIHWKTHLWAGLRSLGYAVSREKSCSGGRCRYGDVAKRFARSRRRIALVLLVQGQLRFSSELVRRYRA
jgi:hypothetical protein